MESLGIDESFPTLPPRRRRIFVTGYHRHDSSKPEGTEEHMQVRDFSLYTHNDAQINWLETVLQVCAWYEERFDSASNRVEGGEDLKAEDADSQDCSQDYSQNMLKRVPSWATETQL